MTTHSSTAPTSDPTVSTPPGNVQEHLNHLESALASLQDQLRSAQKLATIGTMAAMLAHEYNNLAAPVVSYARYALDKSEEPLMRQALEMVLRRLQAMATLSQRLLEYAHDEGTTLEQVRLRKVAELTIQSLGRDLAKDRIRLNVLIDPELTARCNANQLEQVLFNLVLNARQAMLPHPGTLTLDAEPAGGGTVRLHVRDTGPGIAPDVLPNLFTPFFTTKRNARRPDQRGIGLGLAVCREIVESWGGTIEVESTPGQGTTFTLTLPTIE